MSPELRGNHKLVLLAIRRSHTCSKDMRFLGVLLADSVAFALDVVKKVGSRVEDALQFFTDRVKSDPQVVEAFCGASGRSYQFVASSLRERNQSLARLASHAYPIALLEHVPREIGKQLLADKKFVLSIFDSMTRRWKLFVPELNNGNVYSILSPMLKKDCDVCLAAIKCGHIGLNQVPDVCKANPAFWHSFVHSESYLLANLKSGGGNDSGHEKKWETTLAQWCSDYDRNFWRDAMQAHASLWEHRPFADDIEFSKSLDTPGPAIIRRMLAKFPSLSSDLAFWRHFLHRTGRLCFKDDPNLDIGEFLSNHASNSKVLQDKEAMLLAIPLDVSVYKRLHDSLKTDREILEAMVATEDNLLWDLIPFDIMGLHPDLVAEALGFSSKEDFDERLWDFDWANHEDAQANREIVRAWLSKGWGWMEPFPEELVKDEELMLLVAKHNENSFHVVSDELLNDKQFLLQAIGRNGMLYRSISNADLKSDFDVVLAAWAFGEEVGDIFFARDQYRFVTEFAENVRAKLLAQDIFFKTVLCGASSSTSSDCPLRTLLTELGEDTSLALRKHLAELLGIATGGELSKLRKASAHLELWGY